MSAAEVPKQPKAMPAESCCTSCEMAPTADGAGWALTISGKTQGRKGPSHWDVFVVDSESTRILIHAARRLKATIVEGLAFDGAGVPSSKRLSPGERFEITGGRLLQRERSSAEPARPSLCGAGALVSFDGSPSVRTLGDVRETIWPIRVVVVGEAKSCDRRAQIEAKCGKSYAHSTLEWIDRGAIRVEPPTLLFNVEETKVKRITIDGPPRELAELTFACGKGVRERVVERSPERVVVEVKVDEFKGPSLWSELRIKSATATAKVPVAAFANQRRKQ